MYTTQAFVRSGTGFLPQRKINAFPKGACDGFEGRTDIFYNKKERDFLVNMAGCKYVIPRTRLMIKLGEELFRRNVAFQTIKRKVE
jgi:hypothetical protein